MASDARSVDAQLSTADTLQTTDLLLAEETASHEVHILNSILEEKRLEKSLTFRSFV